MEENCYIHGKGCEEDSYSISKWRNQFGNDYPKYHYFYDGFEFERDQSKLFDLKTVLKKYLEPYFEGTLSDLTDGLPTIETDMSDFYLQEKCDGCPSAKRPRPLSQMPPKYCKDSFALIFQIQLAMDDRKICRICNSTDASAECKVCRMSPLRATKIAKEHKKDEDNEKTLLISDLRLGGHAVKLKIDFTYYRCSRRIDFTKALPFLYGDIHIVAAAPEMPVSVLVPQICMPVEDHQTALPFQVSHYLRHAVLRRYKDVYVGDMLDFKATLTNIGNTSRDCRTEVYKLATPVARVGDTECKPGEMVWFDTPILCTEGNVRLIIKKHLQRGEQADGLVADPWEQLDDFPMTPNVDSSDVIFRYRMSDRDVFYGGGVVNGARSITLANDAANRLMAKVFHDTGHCIGVERVRLYTPCFAGDYMEFHAKLHSSR